MVDVSTDLACAPPGPEASRPVNRQKCDRCHSSAPNCPIECSQF